MKPKSIVHSFGESLEESHKLDQEHNFIELYERMWPDVVSAQRIDADSHLQRSGVDRLIVLQTGKQITIDEKVRKEDYGDILLELVSVGHYSTNGFIEKKPGWTVDMTKICDFIAYVVLPSARCYLLPFDLLRNATIANMDAWKANPKCRFPKDSDNFTYITRNIAVPWDILKPAITQQMFRKFGDGKPLPPANNGNAVQLEFRWGN